MRHPFVEAGIGKSTIRELAHIYGLPEFSELPASPCLSSRVETGITIQPEELKSINAIESFIAKRFECKTIRCRLRAEQVVIEADEMALKAISEAMDSTDFALQVRTHLSERFKFLPISLANYKVGSAFIHAGVDHA